MSSSPQKRKDIAMEKIKNNSRKLYNSLRKADAICMTVAKYARNINGEAEKTFNSMRKIMGEKDTWFNQNQKVKLELRRLK